MRKIPILLLGILLFSSAHSYAQYACPRNSDCIIGLNHNLAHQLGGRLYRAELRFVDSSTEGGFGCEACKNGYKFHDVAIIDQENRRPLTKEEDAQFGLPVGSIDCKNNAGDRTSTTAFLAKQDVAISIHAFDIAEKGKWMRLFNPIRDCHFTLRSAVTGQKIKEIPLKYEKKCPQATNNARDLGNCEWSAIKLAESAPKGTPFFNLKVMTAESLVDKDIVAVGFHENVEIDGVKQKNSIKLIDYGTVKPKTPQSPIVKYPGLIQYTVDTGEVASGQPIFTLIDGKYHVVAIHRGTFVRPGNENKPLPFNERTHSNVGYLITQDLFNLIESM